MCHCYAYHSKPCGHRWLHLIRPCAPHMTFSNSPPGHHMTRPTTLLGSTKWYPAPLSTCPDCGLKGQYDGNKIRLYLGKGSRAEREARMGAWGPYGNGFWPVYQAHDGWSGGWTGHVPGDVALRGQGLYGWRGRYQGRQQHKQPGALFGCFGL